MPRTPLLVLSLILALTAACHSGGRAASSDATSTAGATYYTQFALYQEKDVYRTTNYRRGFLVPVNTKATLQKRDSRRIVVQLETGQRLTVENVQKHTNETTDQAFPRIFGAQPVDLARFTQAERDAIQLGRVEPGMSRDAVLVALGPPPAVGTASLDAPEWKYWDSKFSTFLVRFGADGRVAEVTR